MFETNNPRLFGEGNGAGSGDDSDAEQESLDSSIIDDECDFDGSGLALDENHYGGN
ncbi:hypothetical protein [Aeromonas enteropelogenes]|jgi:hypothetical protein|uniref:hypothetical protein n=1 Tax=Aeromonas enteropelogenes TaxID=29489 RepID=UPI003B9E39AD